MASSRAASRSFVPPSPPPVVFSGDALFYRTQRHTPCLFIYHTYKPAKHTKRHVIKPLSRTRHESLSLSLPVKCYSRWRSWTSLPWSTSTSTPSRCPPPSHGRPFCFPWGLSLGRSSFRSGEPAKSRLTRERRIQIALISGSASSLFSQKQKNELSKTPDRLTQTRREGFQLKQK